MTEPIATAPTMPTGVGRRAAQSSHVDTSSGLSDVHCLHTHVSRHSAVDDEDSLVDEEDSLGGGGEIGPPASLESGPNSCWRIFILRPHPFA